MKKIFVLILLMIPLLLNARTFTGVVKDEGGKPLPGVSVMLKSTAGRIRAYAITAKTGAFTLKYEGEDGQSARSYSEVWVMPRLRWLQRHIKTDGQ